MSYLIHRPVRPLAGPIETTLADPVSDPSQQENTRLATTQVLHGSAGALIGAAVGTPGKEGLWAAAGFAAGALFGEMGIVGIALGAFWRKA